MKFNTISQSKSPVRKAIPNQVRKADLPELFQSINWEGEDSLSFILRQIILRATNEVRSREANGNKFSLKLGDVKIEHPKIENYGDYSTNIALILAGKVGMKPRDLAEKIANELNKYIKQHQSITSSTDRLSLPDKLKPSKITDKSPKTVSEVLGNASVAGPGFVNLTIRRDYLITLMHRVLGKENGSGTTSLDKSRDKQIIPETGLLLKEKKIMVEFAHPNTHKEFHIGHLRNISIGESIIRTLEATGAKLFRANYEGDVGLHVAKAIWGVRKKIETELGSDLKGPKGLTPLLVLRELNPANKAKFLGEAYALGNKMYEENEAAKREIIELNKSIYKDPKKVDLWEETRRWSLEYFETVYKRLGSRFDRYYFESEVEAPGKQMVVEGIKKGIFIRDKDGSIYFPGKKYGLNNCVFVTRENYATYEGKDIAVESLEYEEFPFNVDIHVVAHEQKNFFQIAFKALELLSPIQKDRQFHLAYGMVNLKGGKLSSRTGQVITADWLIDQAKERIKKIMEQTSRKDTSDGFGRAIKTPRMVARRDSSEVEGSEEIAEKVAVAAVKYSMLRVNPRIDIAFDIEESVSFDGDSGPYLMYTYARCKSVIRKASDQDTSGVAVRQLTDMTPPMVEEAVKRLNPEELSLLRTLYRFPEVVVEAARTLSPNLICSFLFDLAQKYNLFYNKHSILSPSLKDTSDGVHMHSSEVEESIRQFRLALTFAIARIIKSGLYLLGIETVERM